MIPYDDLVAALATWRAKQGLPAGTLTPAASAAPAQPAPAAKSGGTSKSGPKQAPPGSAARTAPTPMVDDHYDVDDAALLEEASYGDEYGGYAGGGNDEATAIGGAPSPSDATIDEDMFGGSNPGPAPKKKGSGPSKRSTDW